MILIHGLWSYDGSLVFRSGWTGIDFGQYAPTDLVRKVETNAIVSPIEHLAGGAKTTGCPELQRRGVYRTAYKPGALREKLFGRGSLLPSEHPAARLRDIEAIKPAPQPADGFDLTLQIEHAAPVG